MVIGNQILLFNQVAKRHSEIQAEQRLTIDQRCEKAVELAAEHPVSVYWCNLNDEGDLLEKLDKDAYQIKGSMDIDEKEEMLLAFYNRKINKLVTKAKITAFGLNWQHCNHTVYFPTFSYERYYQAIRRFWRFGQVNDVVCDLVFSDGQKRVLDSLIAKANKADQLFSKLNSSLHADFDVKKKVFTEPVKIPSFLK